MDTENTDTQETVASYSEFHAGILDPRIVSFISIETDNDKQEVVAETVANRTTASGTKPVRWTAVLKDQDTGHVHVMVAARVSTQDELDALVQWIKEEVDGVTGEPTVTTVSDAYSNQVHMDPFNGWP